MKFIFVFLVISLAAVSAWSAEDEEQIKESALKECWKKKKLNDEQMESASNWGCLFACVHRKIGYLKADGSLNIERITQGNPYSQTEIQKIYDICVKYARGDPCKLSLCMEEKDFDEDISSDESSY